jgi:hypothetical protein
MPQLQSVKLGKDEERSAPLASSYELLWRTIRRRTMAYPEKEQPIWKRTLPHPSSLPFPGISQSCLYVICFYLLSYFL